MKQKPYDIHGSTCIAVLHKDGLIIGQCRNTAVRAGMSGWLCEYHEKLLNLTIRVEEMNQEDQFMEYLKGQMDREVRMAREMVF
jgi:hypothetical protein